MSWKIRCITSLEQLTQCREDWDRILADNRNNNPFIEFDFVYHWLTFFLPGRELCFYAAEHEGEVVAFFPFIKKKTWFCDYIQFAGFGQANYMDVVALDPWREQALALVMKELLEQKSTVLQLHGMLDSAGTADALIRLCKKQHVPVHRFQTVAPFIDLNMEQTDFTGFLKKKMKKHGGDRKEKRLAKLGSVSFAPLAADRLEDMFRLHERRWQAKMDTSGFTKGQTREFYESLAGFGGSGSLKTRIDGLFVEGRLVGFFYGLVCRDRYVLYVLAHDDHFGIFSPGRMLVKETVADRYQGGVRNFDLSIGYEPYKLDWSTGTDTVSKVLFPGTGLMAHFFCWRASLRGGLIQQLKKSRALVHFKRNTLGKIKNFLSGFNMAVCKKGLAAMRRFIFWRQSVELYRVDREQFVNTPPAIAKSYTPITVKLLLKYPELSGGALQESVERLYHKRKGYCLIQGDQVVNRFWVSDSEDTELIPGRLDKDFVLPKNAMFAYDWMTLDTAAFAYLFLENNTLDSVYVARQARRNEEKPLFDQGFVSVQRTHRKTILGFSLSGQTDIQNRGE